MNTNAVTEKTESRAGMQIENVERVAQDLGGNGGAEPTCTNCQSTRSWGENQWCPDCGYYPAINQCVDLGPEVEIVTQEAPESLMSAIPGWMWGLGFGCLAVVGASVFARVSFQSVASVRALWTITQLVGGLLVFGIAHLMVYIHAIARSDKYGMLDMFMKPVEIWKPTLAQANDLKFRIWLGVWGMLAAICAVLIVGGFQFSAIFDDWGVKRGADTNLLQTISSQARQERESDMSMEEAMNSFVGDAQAGEEDRKNAEEEAKTAEKGQFSADCLIIGYTRTSAGKPDQLLLATVLDGQLKYAGQISYWKLPEDDRLRLVKRFPDLRRNRPFVRNPYSAAWLQPRLMCRITFDEWTQKRMMKNPQFKELLRDVSAN